MKELGYGLTVLLFGTVTLMFKGLLLSGRVMGMIVVPLARMAVTRLSNKREAKPVRQQTVPVQVDVTALAQPQLVEDTGPATVMQGGDFDAADNIITMRLDPPVGVIHLRVHRSAGIVKRDLVISEPALTVMMKGRRHNFPDAPYYAIGGLEAIKDETVALTEKLINSFTNPQGVVETPVKAEAQRADTLAPVVVAKQTPQQEEAKPVAPPAPAEHKPPPQNAKVVAPRVTEGYTYVGKLVKAGTQKFTPVGRKPYEVFQATLALDNSAELSLRGAELARELAAAHCEVGSRVAITPMGKVPVALNDGSEGTKNLYRVQKMGSAKG